MICGMESVLEVVWNLSALWYWSHDQPTPSEDYFLPHQLFHLLEFSSMIFDACIEIVFSHHADEVRLSLLI